MKLPFRASVELGFVAGLMIVIAVGIFAYRSNEALVDNARWVAHTHRVLETLERTSSLLKDAETAERGFVITGNERYLEPYFDARPRIEAEVARVQRLTRDNPRQQQRLDSLAPLVTLRLVRIDQIIAARRTSGSGPAIGLVREGTGLRLMTAIRRDIRQLQAEEARLLAMREVATERRARDARLAITLGSLAAVVILAAAVRILMRDLRERNRAEASARFSEARFRHLVEAADDVIYRADASGHFTYVNPVAVRITGYSEDELLGMHYLRLVHPDHREQTQEFYARQMASGMSNTYFEVRAQGKDGREIWLGQNVRIVGGDIQIGVQAVARDITNKREVERLKSEFVSIVSHELRTPLTAIRGSLGLLASGRLGALTEQGNRLLVIATQNTDRLVRLINDMLDLERLESDRIAMERRDCDAAALMTQAADALQTTAEAAGVRLVVEPAATPLWVDPDRIIQVLLNLLGNAIKFSPRGGVVHLDCRVNADKVWLRVRDEGRGIPADKLETIFGRFQQVDSSDSRQKGGTGLGLAISRSIVEHHGGRIWVESSAGLGSTFVVALPLHPRSEAAAAPGTERSRVLLVEDDVDLTRVLTETLERWGITVHPARTGRDAVRLAHEIRPHLLLLDVRLPEGDGYAVVEALRREPRLREMPTIVYSAWDVDPTDRERLRLGPTEFLTKTRTTSEELEQSVLELLKGSLLVSERSSDD